MAADRQPTHPPRSAERRLCWHYLARSEVGKVRKNNQDAGLASSALLVVADGMGGAAAGDLAAAIAVDAIRPISDRLSNDDTDQDDPSQAHPSQAHPAPLNLLAEAARSANSRIADLIAHDSTLAGMGTTTTAAALDGDVIRLAHIGDSRAYLLRDGHLRQLSRDHSWVQSLIDDGRITAEEATTHPHRSLLLKVINGQAGSVPDSETVELQLGDRLLLCSDGLCGFVEDEVIEGALVDTDREQAMQQLIAAAYDTGGLDNITVIIADLSEAGVTPATDAAASTEQDEQVEDTRVRTGATSGSSSSSESDRTGTVSGRGNASRSDQSSAGIEQVAGPVAEPQILGAAAAQDVRAIEALISGRDKGGGTGGVSGSELGDGDTEDDQPADEDRYAPQPPRRRRFIKPLIAIAIVVAILAAAAGVGYAWTRTQYYVGADGDRVAIYQGLHQTLPGVSLSRVYEVQQVKMDDLPHYYQKRVHSTIDADNLESARSTVHQLSDTAERCRTKSGGNKPSPSPTKATTPHTSSGKHKSSKKAEPGSKGKTPTQQKPSPSGTESPADQSGKLPGKDRC